MATNGLPLPSGPPMPATSVTVQEMDALVREVRSASLYNRQLSSICQVNGLKSTGVKAELQGRITDRKFHSLLTSNSPSPYNLPHHHPFHLHPIHHDRSLNVNFPSNARLIC